LALVVLLSEIGSRKAKNKAPASEGGRYKIKTKKEQTQEKASGLKA
jgi:hypothetical protein